MGLDQNASTFSRKDVNNPNIMGLDQYAATFSRKYVNNPDAGADLTITEGVEPSELSYWRKHPYLQGWMEKLYYDKGGKAESFNCVNVRLDEDDLNRLKEDVESGSLPETTGFFFGDDSCEHYKEQDLKFINDALEAIKDGRIVIYDSWW